MSNNTLQLNGIEIQRLRARRKKTQAEIAALADFSIKKLSRIETSANYPVPFLEVHAIAEGLGVDFLDILTARERERMRPAGASAVDVRLEVAQQSLRRKYDQSFLHTAFSSTRIKLVESLAHQKNRIREFISERRLRNVENLIYTTDYWPFPAKRPDDSDPRANTSLRKTANALQKYFRNIPLSINCECVQPAALAVVRSLRDRWELNLHVEWHDVYAPGQILTAADRESDILITADIPLLLLGSQRDIPYRVVTPLHTQKTHLISRPDTGSCAEATAARRIYVCRNSTGEELSTLWGSMPKNAEVVMVDSHAEFLSIYSNGIDEGEMMATWAPMTTPLVKIDPTLHKYPDFLRTWTSLLLHERWFATSQAKKLSESFITLFLYEWKYFLSLPQQPFEHLPKGLNFMRQIMQATSPN